jgi:BirA family transcriptional regulator, biotin operon repressor / biotin---[acetyl-CoA-carboxylase] ligase
VSPPGECILASLVLRPDASSNAPFYSVVACSLGIVAGVQEITGRECHLKWPNDVIMGRKKLAGVLAEGVSTPCGPSVIAGFGVNVNLDVRLIPEIADTATSLFVETSSPMSRQDLLAVILRHIDENYLRLREGDLDALFARWRSSLAGLGQELALNIGGKTKSGFLLDVEQDGALQVRWEDGSVSRLSDAELSLAQLYNL